MLRDLHEKPAAGSSLKCESYLHVFINQSEMVGRDLAADSQPLAILPNAPDPANLGRKMRDMQPRSGKCANGRRRAKQDGFCGAGHAA